MSGTLLPSCLLIMFLDTDGGIQVDCIYEVNITRGLDIPSFCDRPDFHVAVGLCMGGNDGKSGKCSEEDQKSRLRVKSASTPWLCANCFGSCLGFP